MLRKKWILLLIIFLVVLFAVGWWWADKNNPYSKESWVKPFFTTAVSDNGQITIVQSRPLHVLQTPFSKLFLYSQALFRIEGNVYNSERPFSGSEQQIIDQIHQERFAITKPYVITGGHFAELYVRNFGVFYNAMLDPRIPTSQADWVVRQQVTLQTIATDLELLKQAGKTYTTFFPIDSDTFVATNINTDPSDSLFAIVYTLSAATNDTFISKTLPSKFAPVHYPLQTIQAGRSLLATYHVVLSTAITQYLGESIDTQTGLIKKDITLASARDSVKRQSSFYDNVIAWATAKDASELGLKIDCPDVWVRNSTVNPSPQPSPSGGEGVVISKNNVCDFEKWKQKIIDAFWDGNDGLFINDLSSDAIQNHTYTGEEFIVAPTGFFDLQDSSDKEKLFQMVTYVKKRNLDKPFPLALAEKNDLNNYTNFFIRYFATSYMGESIWSHLGQEYIESLILLSDDHPELLQEARNDLASYKNNIEKYGGYPELYDRKGNIFKTSFYKSVLRTGWVINYEQAKMLIPPLSDTGTH